jgi:hypothetical protein
MHQDIEGIFHKTAFRTCIRQHGLGHNTTRQLDHRHVCMST